MEEQAQLGQIAARLLARPFMIFAGAGLSRSAGVPIASEIENYILEQLGFNEDDQKIFFQAQLPFEAFFEVLISRVDCKPLLTIFGLGHPTRNHLLLAKLARSQIQIIVTTNFDALLEEALVTQRVPFRVYASDQALSRIDWNADEVKVIKLHGTVGDPESLALTIRRVAAQGLATSREKALTELFSRLQESALVVFGYSCSDRFDISPAIRRVSRNDYQILYVQHQESEGTARLKKCDPSHLFANCSAQLLECHADDLVSEIWKEAFHELAPQPTNTTNAWKTHVDNWICILESIHGRAVRPFLAGLMQKAANNWRASNQFLMTALREGIPNVSRAAVHLAIGNNYRDLGDYRMASLHLRASLRIAQFFEQDDDQAEALNSLGIVAEDQDEHDVAVSNYKNSLAIAERTKNSGLQGRCQGNIGIALKNKRGRENLQQALRHHQRALDIARDLGDKRSEGRTLGNLGITYSDLGDKAKARTYYLQAQQVAEDLGDSLHVGIWLHNAGEDAVGSDDREAARLLQEAASIFRSLGQEKLALESETWLAKIDRRSDE